MLLKVIGPKPLMTTCAFCWGISALAMGKLDARVARCLDQTCADTVQLSSKITEDSMRVDYLSDFSRLG